MLAQQQMHTVDIIGILQRQFHEVLEGGVTGHEVWSKTSCRSRTWRGF